MDKKMKIKQYQPGHFMTNDVLPVSFNHLINRFFSDEVNEMSEQKSFFKPSTDIIENEAGYELHLSLPGMNKKDIKIELDNHDLLISGERKNVSENEDNKWHLSEISYGKFSRRFHLPELVDQNNIEAQFEDGILKVKIAKTEAQKPKVIDVK
ncbi:Hsp20/alpha crystallin family protein [bacterium]|nr:Hsp20/alpha crystallin family protein [bacterium]